MRLLDPTVNRLTDDGTIHWPVFWCRIRIVRDTPEMDSPMGQMLPRAPRNGQQVNSMVPRNLYQQHTERGKTTRASNVMPTHRAEHHKSCHNHKENTSDDI